MVWERLSQEFPKLQINRRDSYEGIEEDLREAEILFTLSLRPEQFAAALKLRWIHAPSAAVHQFLFAELVNSEVVLTNSSEVHGPVVAEHVMALILALAKKIPQAVRLQQKHVWGKEAIWNEGPHPREIAGATLGLIGVGNIGLNDANGIGYGHARDRGARDVRREAPKAYKPSSLPRRLNEVLQQSDSWYWPRR